ncbi:MULTISPECIES: asparagine synthase (glutamine-hydrolyzing) [unclassified Nocardia]|uniref:asparagine synthase (glutamine-hydrolyzing) n=1 Tax=unclassified Nocardia TaxID=2637762 RepID=UPI001CE3DCFE|nr:MULTISPECIES: asparagine synthase (glutamine-hydrolyzing) [unclassified Nocardia]
MCGFAGWVDWARDLRDQRHIVEEMTETLTPRGPDAGGVWASATAVFGHRRLAIIDIDGGAQPMTFERAGAAECAMVFAGEIYNFTELRDELRRRGHQFRTRSDTEVLLHCYLEWGAECVTRLNGMFAFAIWDPDRETVLLARDRLGIKPLLYHAYDGGVVFGSEHKALLAHPLVRPEVDIEGFNELLCVIQTPGNAVFRNIASLPPGHIALVDRNGVHEHRYWGLTSRPHTDGPAETVATVRDLLADTVKRQLVADVSVGTLLSGGLDSSAVTALSARTLAGEGAPAVHSFAFDFVGNDVHFQPSVARPELDTPFARAAAAHIGTAHTEVMLDTPAVLDALPEVVRARDLPGFPDLVAAQYLLFREVKSAVTVALSGESADEVFGGYPWFHRPELRNTPGFPWAVAIDSYLPVLDRDLVARLRSHEYLADRYAQALTEVPRLPGEAPEAARTRELFYLTMTRWLPILLDSKDRTSMRNGLEARVPFCDHRLVEYVWNVPWELKTMDGRNKGLLRAAVADLLPAAVLDRRKTSFPIAQNPEFDSGVRTLLRDELADPNSPLLPIIDVTAVRKLLDTDLESGGFWRSTDTVAWLAHIACWLRAYRVELV